MLRALVTCLALVLTAASTFADTRRDCAQHGDLELQVRACSDIIRRNGTAAWAYVNRAWAYLDQGKLDQAIADTTKVIQINPRNAAAHHNRAAAYHGKADYDRTIADATKACQ